VEIVHGTFKGKQKNLATKGYFGPKTETLALIRAKAGKGETDCTKNRHSKRGHRGGDAPRDQKRTRGQETAALEGPVTTEMVTGKTQKRGEGRKIQKKKKGKNEKPGTETSPQKGVKKTKWGRGGWCDSPSTEKETWAGDGPKTLDPKRGHPHAEKTSRCQLYVGKWGDGGKVGGKKEIGKEETPKTMVSSEGASK